MTGLGGYLNFSRRNQLSLCPLPYASSSLIYLPISLSYPWHGMACIGSLPPFFPVATNQVPMFEMLLQSSASTAEEVVATLWRCNEYGDHALHM